MSISARRWAAVGGLVGPGAFVTAWSVLGARRAGYAPAHDAISNLAAQGAPTRAAMTAGFVAFGIGVPVYAVALRDAVAGRAWMAAVATGVAALGVAVSPLGTELSDAAHRAFAAAGYASLVAVPLLAAPGLRAQGRRRLATASTALGVGSAACLVATTAGTLDGLLQRAGLTMVDGWIMASAVAMLAGRLSPGSDGPCRTGAGATGRSGRGAR